MIRDGCLFGFQLGNGIVKLLKLLFLLVTRFEFWGCCSRNFRNCYGLRFMFNFCLSARTSLLVSIIFFPLTEVRVVAWEISNHSFSFEHKQVLHEAIHKVSVVGYDDQAARETVQKFLQDIQGHQVQVVCRFVEDEEVWVFDQYQKQLQSSALSSTHLSDGGKLLLGRKSKLG